MIPRKDQNPKGLHRRYYIQKIVGIKKNTKALKMPSGKISFQTVIEPKLKEVDEGAEYFVMRLDDGGKNAKHIQACRKAVLYYAELIKDHLPELSKDLMKRYGE